MMLSPLFFFFFFFLKKKINRIQHAQTSDRDTAAVADFSTGMLFR